MAAIEMLPTAAVHIHDNLDHARQRLDQTDRAFARDFDQAIADVNRSNQMAALVRRSATAVQGRSHERELELELEI